MKKIKFIAAFIITIMVFLIPATINVYALYDYAHEVFSDIKYYGLDLVSFNKFIDSPSKNLLEEDCQWVEAYVVQDGRWLNDKYIEEHPIHIALEIYDVYDSINQDIFLYRDDEKQYWDSELSYLVNGFKRDGYIGAISVDNLKYLHKDNLLNILKDNGIDEPLIDYALVSVGGDMHFYIQHPYPLTLWLKTQNDNYFIVPKVNAYSPVVDYSNSDFMTYNQYVEKYSARKAALYLDDKNITTDDCVKIQSGNVFISMECLLKELGNGSIQYSEDKRRVYFTVNNEPYVYQIACADSFRIEDESPEIQVFNMQVHVLNEGYYVHGYNLNKLLNLYGKRCVVDYKNNVVNIVNDTYGLGTKSMPYELGFIADNTDVYINDEYVSESDEVRYNILDTPIFRYDYEPSCYIASYIKNGVFMIPVSVASEYLFDYTEWDNNTKTFIAVKGLDKIKFTVGQNSININGEDILVDTPAEVKDGHIFIPAKSLANAVDFDLYWQAESKSVRLTQKFY